MLLYITVLFSFFSELTLQQARQSYEHAVTDMRLADVFLQQTNNTTNTIMLGYRGAVTMAKAKHYSNPVKKLEVFSTGKTLLEKAIYCNADNIELRYLRLTVQSNCPSFLGYNHIATDKSFILLQLSTCTDSYLKNKIVTFMMSSSFVSDDEKRTLKHVSKLNITPKP